MLLLEVQLLKLNLKKVERDEVGRVVRLMIIRYIDYWNHLMHQILDRIILVAVKIS